MNSSTDGESPGESTSVWMSVIVVKCEVDEISRLQGQAHTELARDNKLQEIALRR